MVECCDDWCSSSLCCGWRLGCVVVVVAVADSGCLDAAEISVADADG